MVSFGITKLTGNITDNNSRASKLPKSSQAQKKMDMRLSSGPLLEAMPSPKNTPRFGHKSQSKIQEIEAMLDRGAARLAIARTLQKEGDDRLRWAVALEKEAADLYIWVEKHRAAAHREREKAVDCYDDAESSLRKADRSKYHWKLYEQDAADSEAEARDYKRKAQEYDDRAEDAIFKKNARYRDARTYRAEAKTKHADSLRIKLEGNAISAQAREMMDNELRKKRQGAYDEDSFTPQPAQRASTFHNSTSPAAPKQDNEDTFTPTTDPTPGIKRRFTVPSNFTSKSRGGTDGESPSNQKPGPNPLSSQFEKMRMDEDPESSYTQGPSKTYNPTHPQKIFLGSPLREKPIDPKIFRSGYANSPGWWQPSVQEPDPHPPIEKKTDPATLLSGYTNLKAHTEQKLGAPSPKAEAPSPPQIDPKKQALKSRMDDPKQYTHEYTAGRHTLKTTLLFDAIEGEYFDLATILIKRAPQLLSRQKDVVVRKAFNTSIQQIVPADIVKHLKTAQGREFAEFFNQKMADVQAKEKIQQAKAKAILVSNQTTGTEAQSAQDQAQADIKVPLENFPPDFPVSAIVTKEDELQKLMMDELLGGKRTATALKKQYHLMGKKYHTDKGANLEPYERDMNEVKFTLLGKNYLLIEEAIKDSKQDAEVERKVNLLQQRINAKITAAKLSIGPCSEMNKTPLYKIWEAELKAELQAGRKRYGLAEQYKFMCNRNQAERIRAAAPLNEAILSIKRNILDQLHQEMLLSKGKRNATW